jgi:hypothetical protein
MIMSSVVNIVNDIRNGIIDVNIQENFMSILIKGLLYNLTGCIKVRNNPVPHFILHTGDDRMWLETKGYDASVEPLTISNENAVYSIMPKCIVNPNGIDLDINQLTSPYSLGTLQYSDPEVGTIMLSGEFRRVPIKISIDLKYFTESYTDMLELIQYVISNLAFIRTYDIIYMGQKIKCSYKIPESFSDEHTMDIDGAMSESRDHNINFSIEVETNMPVFNNKTIMSTDKIIVTPVSNVYPTNTLKIDEAK